MVSSTRSACVLFGSGTFAQVSIFRLESLMELVLGGPNPQPWVWRPSYSSRCSSDSVTHFWVSPFVSPWSCSQICDLLLFDYSEVNWCAKFPWQPVIVAVHKRGSRPSQHMFMRNVSASCSSPGHLKLMSCRSSCHLQAIMMKDQNAVPFSAQIILYWYKMCLQAGLHLALVK